MERETFKALSSSNSSNQFLFEITTMIVKKNEVSISLGLIRDEIKFLYLLNSDLR